MSQTQWFPIIDCITPYNTEPLMVTLSRYNNGNLAILLEDIEGFPAITASVNPPGDTPLADGLVAIKNWSENDGIPEALVKAKLLAPEPKYHIASGFVSIPVYEFGELLKEMIEENQSWV